MAWAVRFIRKPSSVKDPCAPHRPTHFGGPMDTRNLSKLREVDCGETKQRYYVRR